MTRVNGVERLSGTVEPDVQMRGQRPPRSHLPRVEFRLEQRRHVRGLLSIVTAVALSWCARFIPTPARDYLARKGGDLTYRLAREYRQSVSANLRVVFGADYPNSKLRRHVREVFRNGSRNMVDLLMVPHLGSEQIVDRVPLKSGSWHYLDDAFSKGKGVVVVTAHLGAFDFVGQALHHRGYKLTSVTGRTTSRFIFDGVTFLRRSHDMHLVEASPSGIRRVIKSLHRGEGAVFLTDRDFFNSGTRVEFFGRETTLSQGAIRIARDTGAMVVPIFGLRTTTGHGLRIEPGFLVEKTANREADIRNGIEQLVPVLERAISATPEQWAMFQPVWPSEPDDHHSGP